MLRKRNILDTIHEILQICARREIVSKTAHFECSFYHSKRKKKAHENLKALSLGNIEDMKVVFGTFVILDSKLLACSLVLVTCHLQ